MSGTWALRGWARLRFTGPAPERMLTLLGERGVPFRDADPPEAFSLTFRIPLRYVKRTEALAAAAGGELAVLERRGLPTAGARLRRRWFPAVLLAGALLALLWSQARIWDIEITGSETIPDGVLRQALAECGVDIGARWVGMSQDAVRNGVILRLPGIRWMTVTMQGSRARVIVREKREAVEPVPEGEYAKVVADRAGLVTAVYALRGTAAAEENRFVLPGETLIDGAATGRFGVQGATRAIGYAEVRTWVEMTAAAPAEAAVKTHSGEKSTRYSLIFGRRRINFGKDSSICPADCDKIIESYALAVPGVFTLPLALERTTLSAYGTEAVPAEERREELEQTLMAALERRMGRTGEIVSADFAAWEADGMLYVTLSAECRERTGRTEPLTEAEVAAILEKIPKTEE